MSLFLSAYYIVYIGISSSPAPPYRGTKFYFVKVFFDVSHCHIRTYGPASASGDTSRGCPRMACRGCPRWRGEASGGLLRVSPAVGERHLAASRALEGGVFQSWRAYGLPPLFWPGGTDEINCSYVKCPLLNHTRPCRSFSRFPIFAAFYAPHLMRQYVRWLCSVLLPIPDPLNSQHSHECTEDLFPSIFCS